MTHQGLSNLTYDEWVRHPEKPTFLFDVPGVGTVGLYTSPKRQNEAVARGEATFSPREWLALVVAYDEGLIDTEGARAVARAKRAFPGSRVAKILTEVEGERDRAQAYPGIVPANPDRMTTSTASARAKRES